MLNGLERRGMIFSYAWRTSGRTGPRNCRRGCRRPGGCSRSCARGGASTSSSKITTAPPGSSASHRSRRLLSQSLPISCDVMLMGLAHQGEYALRVGLERTEQVTLWDCREEHEAESLVTCRLESRRYVALTFLSAGHEAFSVVGRGAFQMRPQSLRSFCRRRCRSRAPKILRAFTYGQRGNRAANLPLALPERLERRFHQLFRYESGGHTQSRTNNP